MKSFMEWSAGSLPSALLVIAPHPDDEVLGCGVLMRRVAGAGGKITVAWMTDGGGSNGDLAPTARRALVERRQNEAMAGLAALGIHPAAICFFGYPDGFLGASERRMGEARDRLQQMCDVHAIDAVAVTDAGDAHPDHRAAFAIAKRLTAKRLYSYPISARYDGEPYTPPPGAIFIPGEPGGFKRAALERHRSQSEAEGAIYPLSLDTIDRFCTDPEIFIPVAGGEL